MQQLVAAFRGEDHLRLAVAVAEVDEEHAAVVAIGVHPAGERDLPADVGNPKFAARMSPQQGSILAEMVSRVEKRRSAYGSDPFSPHGIKGDAYPRDGESYLF